MEIHDIELERLSFWQLVFFRSKANGAPYEGDQLPRSEWEWPKDTYFRRRLLSCGLATSPQQA